MIFLSESNWKKTKEADETWSQISFFQWVCKSVSIAGKKNESL